MPKIITTNSVSIAGGQTVSVSSDAIEAEATSQIDVNIEPNATEITIEIQPSPADQIHVLLISSTFYGSDLTYKFSDGTTDSSAITLDVPQSFSGTTLAPIVSFDPTQLKMTMAVTGEEATISIFIARTAKQ